jgi:uncharacterized protein (DUF302 family)
MAEFGIRRDLKADYDTTLEALPEAFSAEGFGVLTEIDVKHTLKKKIDVDFRRYKILGVCNPQLAHRALSTRVDVGLLLPCNVIVYETDQGTAVTAIDPLESVGRVGLDELASVAQDARKGLTAALDRLEKKVSA